MKTITVTKTYNLFKYEELSELQENINNYFKDFNDTNYFENEENGNN